MTVIERLPLRVRPAADEPAYGLLNRLALRHDADSVAEFAQQVECMNADWIDDVRWGRRLQELAVIAGANHEDIYRSSLRRDKGSLYLGQVMLATRSRSVRLKSGRICSACLLEDMDTRGGPDDCRATRRSFWDISAFVSCPVHHVALATHCGVCKLPVSRDWLNPGRCPGGHFLTGASASAGWGAGQQYLLDRLGSAPASGGQVLDDLPVLAAAQAMSVFGRAHLFGRDLLKRDLTPTEASEALALGFETLSEWPHGVFSVLDKLRAVQSRGKPCASKSYGWGLVQWLESAGSNIEPIQRAVLEHYVKPLIHAQRNCKPVRNRNYRTDIFSIGKKIHADPFLIRDYIEHNLRFRFYDSEKINIYHNAIYVKANFSRHVYGRELAAYHLGLSFDQIGQVLNGNYLPAVHPKYLYFDRSTVDFLLHCCSIPRDQQGDDSRRSVPLPEAAQKLGKALPTLINAVIQKRLPVLGVNEAHRGLRTILVNMEDAQAVAPSVPETSCASLAAKAGLVIGTLGVQMRLGIWAGKMHRFVSRGVISSALWRGRKIFSAQEIDALAAKLEGQLPDW